MDSEQAKAKRAEYMRNYRAKHKDDPDYRAAKNARNAAYKARRRDERIASLMIAKTLVDSARGRCEMPLSVEIGNKKYIISAE